jgi:limonene-1,2-epoxide hydrolase
LFTAGDFSVNNTDSERDRKIKVIEQYFRCVVDGNLKALPIADDYGSESPQSGVLEGEKAIAYLGMIGAEMSDIRVVQLIVDGDFVATHFEEITARGILPVVGLFELKGDKVCFVRVFFDSAHPAA